MYHWHIIVDGDANVSCAACKPLASMYLDRSMICPTWCRQPTEARPRVWHFYCRYVPKLRTGPLSRTQMTLQAMYWAFHAMWPAAAQILYVGWIFACAFLGAFDSWCDMYLMRCWALRLSTRRCVAGVSAAEENSWNWQWWGIVGICPCDHHRTLGFVYCHTLKDEGQREIPQWLVDLVLPATPAG